MSQRREGAGDLGGGHGALSLEAVGLWGAWGLGLSGDFGGFLGGGFDLGLRV